MFDPHLKTWQEGLPLDINKTLKRRYFLVEKAKNANVIGTLQTPTSHCPLLFPHPPPPPPKSKVRISHVVLQYGVHTM